MSVQTTNLYGSIAAEIYDIDKPLGALPDTAFYLDRLAGVDGPILEPACGSGRALVPLAQAGHAIWGFDASPDMLERCRARAEAAGVAAELSQQRFEDFTYDERFAAVVLPVSSFTLIGDFAAALAVLRRFHDHLRPGGLLMLDLQPLSVLARPIQDRRSWTNPQGELLTLEGAGTGVDWGRQTFETRYRYERWRDHQLVESQIDPMIQRAWSRTEFELALAHTGFGEVRVSGGYDRSRGARSGDRVLTFEATALSPT
jgi:SAM-dependent methyltransferase